MCSVNGILEKANKYGIQAKVWHKGENLRIYAKSFRKDVNVFLECDGIPEEITGAELKVFINTDQHPNWVKSQQKIYQEEFKPLFYAYVLEYYKDANLNSYGPDIQAMVAEARKFDGETQNV